MEDYAEESERQLGECHLGLTYAATSEAWFQPLLKYPQCFSGLEVISKKSFHLAL